MKKNTRLAAARILLVEDMEIVADSIAQFLEEQGHAVSRATSGREGLRLAREQSPDLVVLDIGLPDIDGISLCRELKSQARTRAIPVLMLTARTSTESQLSALEAHADHYLTKPVRDLAELYRWIAALLARRDQSGAKRDLLRVAADFSVDLADHKVVVGQTVIHDLPDTLFRLLAELAARPGELLSRSYLVDRVWSNSVKDAEVDVAVARLRKRLGPALGDRIESIRGQGFRLVP